MASITSLPNEITDMILDYLSFRSILGLSETCKRLHKATLPQLYRVISMQWSGLAPTGTTSRRPKIEKLLRTLIERPDFARMVKNIEFRARDCVFWRDDGVVQLSVQFSDICISEEERRLYERMIDAFQLPQAEYWKKAISRDSNLYVIMMLVISQCTHLEVLSTSIVFLMHGDWLKNLIKHALRSTQGVQRLRKLASVEVTSDAHGEDWRTEPLCLKETLLHLLYLPSVSTLDLTAITDDPEPYHNSRQSFAGNLWPLHDIPTARSLTALHLRRTQISPNTLESLLKQTPNLRELRYDCFKPSSSGRLDLTRLRAGLQHVRSTLTHLTVRFEMYSDEDEDDIEQIGSVSIGRLGSLQDFKELTTLSVSCAVLFGESDVTPIQDWQLASVLPFHLQKLTIYDDMWGFYSFGITDGVPLLETFEEFFNGDSMGLLELTDFVHDIRNRAWACNGYWEDFSTRSRLRQMCKSEGIRCKILQNDKSGSIRD